MKRFWEVEEITDRKPLSLEEQDCESLYNTTTERDHEGRYIVRLPKKPTIDHMLGDSKSSALHRFNLLERRLEANEELKNGYHKFMKEYLSLRHMELAPDGVQ